MGDERTCENVAALRAITSTDGMTADYARIPHDILASIFNRIINEVRGITVLFMILAQNHQVPSSGNKIICKNVADKFVPL